MLIYLIFLNIGLFFSLVVRPSSHSMNDSMMSGFDVLDKSSVEPDQIGMMFIYD